MIEYRVAALEMIVRALIQTHPDLARFYSGLNAEIEAMKMRVGATRVDVEQLEDTVRGIVAPHVF